MVHTVQVEDTFRGPMDLLLHLVKRDEIDIHDIPISKLTRSYVAEMEKIQDDLDVDTASEFMAMASMLIEIKGRMLLPAPEEDELEEDDEFDPRAGLVKALLEYKRFKEAAAALGERAEEHAMRFGRIAPRPDFADADDGEVDDVSPNDLLVAFQNMLEVMLQPQEADQIVYDEVPTEVRVRQILDTVAEIEHTTFSKLLSSKPTRGEMVGFFIALLELIRQRKIIARQSARFTDIIIEARPPDAEPVCDSAASFASLRARIAPVRGRIRPALFAEISRPAIPTRPVRGHVPFLPNATGGGEYRLTESRAATPYLAVTVAGTVVPIRVKYTPAEPRISTAPSSADSGEAPAFADADLAEVQSPSQPQPGEIAPIAPVSPSRRHAPVLFAVPALRRTAIQPVRGHVPFLGTGRMPCRTSVTDSCPPVSFLAVPTRSRAGSAPTVDDVEAVFVSLRATTGNPETRKEVAAPIVRETEPVSASGTTPRQPSHTGKCSGKPPQLFATPSTRDELHCHQVRSRDFLSLAVSGKVLQRKPAKTAQPFPPHPGRAR